MDKVSIIWIMLKNGIHSIHDTQVSMISNYRCYSSIHGIQLKYSDFRKKWYLIPNFIFAGFEYNSLVTVVIMIGMAAIVAGVAVMEAEEAEDTTTVEVNIVLQFQL